ncbi:hypothetical protein ACFQZ4_53600 [Catellatospora coxensis]
MNTDTRGRGWSRFGALLGGVISVAAGPTPTSPGRCPGRLADALAVLGSIAWPVSPVRAIEILVRVACPLAQWSCCASAAIESPVAGVGPTGTCRPC